MLFKGRLRLPSDPGEGIPIDLELEDVYLSLDSDGEDFGEWRLDTVEIKRLFSNQFSMLLDGEEMVFIADDALGFAYDGLSAIEDVQSRLSKRRVFKGRKPKKRKLTVATDAADEAEVDAGDEETEEVPPEPTRPDIPMPEVVPFFPEKSPSFADSVAESAVEDDAIAPVAPRPIEPERPADVPVEPAKAPETSPAAQDPQPTPQEVGWTPPPNQPSVSPPLPQQETPVPPAPEPPEEEDDDEFVIEEVAAFGYVPNMASAVPSEPERTEETFEIEEADAATGAVHRQVHPLGEPEPGPVQRAPEVHPLGEPEPESKSDPQLAPEPEPEPAATPEPVAPAAPATNDSGFGQWSSNGRSAPQPQPEPEETDSDPDGPQTQRSGRHERSSTKSRSLFGRKKSREPEAHEHRYESSKTVGGITRSVCAVCGHVSFAGEDVYQDW